MQEPWKRPRKVKTKREYRWCRQRIEKLVADGTMTLEEIANAPPGDSMKRQARKMWREYKSFGKLLIRNEKIPEKSHPVRGRFAISYCLGKFEFLGTEEEVRLKAETKALVKLVAWKEGRISFEDLVDYTIVKRLDSKVASRGKSSSLAVKR